MTMQLSTRSGRPLTAASPEVLAEFADVECELARVGITVPPASPTDTVSARFLVLMAHVDRYDQARRAHPIAV